MKQAGKNAKTTFNQTVEQGFAIGSVLLVCALAAVVFLSYRFVNKMSESNKEQAQNLEQAFSGEPEPVDEEDRYDESSAGPSVSEQQAREENIRTVNVTVDSLSAQLTAQLPGTYTGTCYADIELPNGDGYKRYVTPLDKEHACTIYIPVANLSAGKTWNFKMGFYTTRGDVKGSHPQSTFRL